MALAARLVINAVAIWIAAHWVAGIHIVSEGNGLAGDLLVLLAIAVVFTIINAIVKPLVKLLSLPLVILTLGLFLLVINALMLKLTAAVTETTQYGLRVEGFWAAIWGGIIIAIVNWVLGALVRDRPVRS
ncbi:phage holin family protein [Skermania sp. ID1734]|uniref:phage holin family protein n=1 Tax=Skermania sp. ID1734 TaxID=2597516 RepID=UPI00117F1F7B|nr:phage holin family protein [Skermania sp. ID1734]TSD95126.1 phage holin family protein [Skermania sp. ID1734]